MACRFRRALRRPDGRLGAARRARGRALLLRLHGRGRPTRSSSSTADPDRRSRPEPAAAEPPAHGVPPADALPRATSASPCRSRSRWRRSITGRFGEGWLADTRRTTLVAWGFLTVGILLGAWWSYEVLGWGGYWGWDPVENASLLPWLTGTAFIHSVMVQERRGMLRVWNLSLVLATFCLTILGTFLTRSGVVNSVHAFTQSSIGPWLLGVPRRRRRHLRRADRVARRQAARARVASTRRCRARPRSCSTTCSSPGSRSWCCSGTVFPLVAEAVRGNAALGRASRTSRA